MLIWHNCWDWEGWDTPPPNSQSIVKGTQQIFLCAFPGKIKYLLTFNNFLCKAFCAETRKMIIFQQINWCRKCTLDKYWINTLFPTAAENWEIFHCSCFMFRWLGDRWPGLQVERCWSSTNSARSSLAKVYFRAIQECLLQCYYQYR